MAGSEAFVGGWPLLLCQAVCSIVSASSWDGPRDFGGVQGAFPVTQPFLGGRVFMEQMHVFSLLFRLGNSVLWMDKFQDSLVFVSPLYPVCLVFLFAEWRGDQATTTSKQLWFIVIFICSPVLSLSSTVTRHPHLIQESPPLFVWLFLRKVLEESAPFSRVCIWGSIRICFSAT